MTIFSVLRIRTRDPLPFRPREGSGMDIKSGMNNPDHISESLKNFWVKMLKLFDEDPGWKQFGSGMEKSRIRDKHPGRIHNTGSGFSRSKSSGS